MTVVRAYGDRRDDGLVQLAFALPLPLSPSAIDAARRFAARHGLHDVEVVSAEAAGTAHTRFVVYGRSDVEVAVEESLWSGSLDGSIAAVDRALSSRASLVLVGACLGSDAHSVGLDAILSLKGFAGEPGLEAYASFKVTNLGSQIDPRDLATIACARQVDAVLVSVVVTQRGLHREAAEQLVAEVRARGVRDRVLLVLGGPRVTVELAAELGFDVGFGAGTRPSQVAAWLAARALERR